MRQAVFTLFFLCSLQGFSQSNDLSDLSWYRMLTGKIGKYSVTMHLHKAGNVYRGFYYYMSTQKPLYFYGDDTSVIGEIKLECYPDPRGDVPESFSFSFSRDSVTGTWSGESGKSLPFSAVVTKMPVDFTYVFTEGVHELWPGVGKSPIATYEVSSIWPLGATDANEFVKKTIRGYFSHNNTGNEDVGVVLLRQMKLFFKSYQEDNKDVAEEDLEDHSFAYNQDEIEHLMILFQNQNLVTLAGPIYFYAGGAHGMHAIGYKILDLKNKKELSLEDILTESSRQNLGPLLEKHFRRQYKVKDSETLEDAGLFDNKIEPTSNFYVTGKGIGFIYNPYEIGPYAMGEIDLFIPFTELGDGLRTEIKALLE